MVFSGTGLTGRLNRRSSFAWPKMPKVTSSTGWLPKIVLIAKLQLLLRCQICHNKALDAEPPGRSVREFNVDGLRPSQRNSFALMRAALIRAIRKWFAIRSYARRLPKDLVKRYGRSEYYSPAQIIRTVETLSFNSDWIAYAFCMHCRFSDIASSHSAVAEQWSALRSEIGKRFYRGSTDFTSESFRKPRNRYVENLNDTMSSSDASNGGDGF